METTNFNLQQAVADYLNSIRQQGNISADDEAELKTHLTETVDSLLQKQLSEEEAFIVAIKRLGKTEVLAEEYNKVNPSIQPQIIWAYLFIGFGLISSAFWIFSFLYQLFFKFIKINLSNTDTGLFLFISINILICISLWMLIVRGRGLSKKLNSGIEKNPWLLTILVFLLPVTIPLINSVARDLGITINVLINPDELFQYDIMKRGLADFSYYLVLLFIVSVMLLSVVQASKKKFSFESLFTDPSVLFLILFGICTETMAGMSRVIGFEEYGTGFLNYFLFGTLFAFGTFPIVYFNHQKIFFKILLFAVFGFLTESIVGTYATILEGRTYHAVIYFILALIGGIILGYSLATGLKKKKELATN